METAIKWSPNSTLASQRFLFADVSGRSFNLGTITKYDPNHAAKLQYDLSPAYRQEVPSFRALDWAPFDENVVAVGTPSGETKVLRIDDSGRARSFPAKIQRLCNAVAFGRTGLLATGLEKVRNDFCLNVWDVNQSRSPAVGLVRSTHVEPLRKLASSEAISSIKFFSTQPEVLVVGVKGVGVRCYDLRESTGNPSLQFQTACVHNIAIDPLDENYFACAGTQKDTTIQIWDCRYGSPYTASSLSSNQGSSFGSGSDQNASQGPVITYPNAFAPVKTDSGKEITPGTIWSLRFCKGKSGLLGALASNGDFRIFETQQVYGDQYDVQRRVVLAEKADELPWQIFTRRVHRVERAFDDSRSRRTAKERIVSFDFTNLAGPKGMPTAIFLRGNESVEIYELRGPPSAVDISASGRLAIGKARNHRSRTVTTVEDKALLKSAIDIIYADESDNASNEQSVNGELGLRERQAQVLKGADGEKTKNIYSSSQEAHENIRGMRDGAPKVLGSEAIRMATIARRRCLRGYQFTCRKNIKICKENRWLQDMWTWIQRSKNHAANKTMTMGPLDLSYLGVYRLWNQDLGFENTSRKSSNAQTNFANVLVSLAQNLGLPNNIEVKTGFLEHRQLCLYSIGLGLKYDKILEEVNALSNDCQQTKAASLAILLGQNKLAAKALRTGSLQPHHRALSLALAGYVKGNKDESWNEVVESILKDIEDPYSRAIFTLVKHSDWHDVLKETSLPLRERVGIALLYLPDEELTKYINITTSEAIKTGDIEGIVLTGLNSSSVSLFETYIRKFSDLQTAVLALSHTCPRFFTDPRVTVWRETYRSHMNHWRLYDKRAKFDQALTKLSRQPPSSRSNDNSNSNNLLRVVPRQYSLRCTYCEQPLDRNLSHSPGTTSSFSAENQAFPHIGWHQGSIFGDAKSGTLCPKCGRHMPRCSVCKHWIGVPDGRGKSGRANVAILRGRRRRSRRRWWGNSSGGEGKWGSSGSEDGGIERWGKGKEKEEGGSGGGGGGGSSSSGEEDERRRRRKKKESVAEKSSVLCVECGHVTHMGHAREWFARHKLCPEEGCLCPCGEKDNGGGGW